MDHKLLRLKEQPDVWTAFSVRWTAAPYGKLELYSLYQLVTDIFEDMNHVNIYLGYLRTPHEVLPNLFCAI